VTANRLKQRNIMLVEKDNKIVQWSKAWGLQFSVDAFADSCLAGHALRKLVKGFINVQWIVVRCPGDGALTGSIDGDNSVSQNLPVWRCWVSFPRVVHRTIIESWLPKLESKSPDVYVADVEFVPISILTHCIQGHPFVQYNVPVDWKGIEDLNPKVIDRVVLLSPSAQPIPGPKVIGGFHPFGANMRKISKVEEEIYDSDDSFSGI